MTFEQMDDLLIAQQVAAECDLRRDSERNPDADPSLYAPWGKLTYTAARETVRIRRDGRGNSARPD